MNVDVIEQFDLSQAFFGATVAVKQSSAHLFNPSARQWSQGRRGDHTTIYINLKNTQASAVAGSKSYQCPRSCERATS